MTREQKSFPRYALIPTIDQRCSTGRLTKIIAEASDIEIYRGNECTFAGAQSSRSSSMNKQSSDVGHRCTRRTDNY